MFNCHATRLFGLFLGHFLLVGVGVEKMFSGIFILLGCTNKAIFFQD